MVDQRADEAEEVGGVSVADVVTFMNRALASPLWAEVLRDAGTLTVLTANLEAEVLDRLPEAWFRTHEDERIRLATFLAQNGNPQWVVVPPLTTGEQDRIGKLRGYGNAIVPQVGAFFIEAAMAALDDLRVETR